MKAEVLAILKKNQADFTSGEEISRELGVSRAAVWKSVQQLEGEGYVFTAVSKKGYRLVSCPDILSYEEIAPELKTKTIGRRIVHFASVGSTNDEARKLAEKGEPEGTAVISEIQTEGRGRVGTKWRSDTGNGIQLSLILRPDIPLSEAGKTADAVCRAVGGAIENVMRAAGSLPELTLRLPDDILLGGRKVCGILTESAGELDRVRYIISGIGIFVNQEKEELPQDPPAACTSLKLETGREIPRRKLAAEILNEIEETYKNNR